jgi:hypothetical protein
MTTRIVGAILTAAITPSSIIKRFSGPEKGRLNLRISGLFAIVAIASILGSSQSMAQSAVIPLGSATTRQAVVGSCPSLRSARPRTAT